MIEKDAAATIRNRIYLLANGKAGDIISEMMQEVEAANITLLRIKEYSDDIPASPQEILSSLRLHLRGAEKITPLLGALENHIAEIERKPGIQRYRQVQKGLNEVTLHSADWKTYQSELHSLKTIYTRELSDLVSKTHQEIVHRLNLIQYWKSMIYIGIRFYEELKNFLLKRVLSQSHRIDDADFQEYLQEKLDQLRERMIIPTSSNVSRSTLQMANLNFLKETLKRYLDEVVRLENTIFEKKEILRQLGEAVREMEIKIGIRRTQSEVVSQEIPLPKRETEIKTHTPPPPPPIIQKDSSKPSSRMIFSSKKKNP